MRIPTLDSTQSLYALRREIRYTLVRLRGRAWAKAVWVPTYEALLKETDAAIAAQEKLRDASEDAEAGIDAADEPLDWLVRTVSNTARSTLKGEALDELKTALLGDEPPSELARPRLNSQLTKMLPWPAILKAATPKALQDLGRDLEPLLKAGSDAEKTLEAAEQAIEVFTATVRVPLFKKVNASRQTLGGEARAQKHGPLGQSEEEGLFRISERQRQRIARPVLLAQAQAVVKELAADLALAQQHVVELQAQAQADAEEAARRQAQQKALEELRKQNADTQARIAELEKELK